MSRRLIAWLALVAIASPLAVLAHSPARTGAPPLGLVAGREAPGAEQRKAPGPWLLVRIDSPLTALTRLRQEAGGEALAALVSLMPLAPRVRQRLIDDVAAARRAGTTAPQPIALGDGESPGVRLRLDAPITLGLSWVPDERVLTASLSDPDSAARALRQEIDEDTVPFEREGASVFLGESWIAAVMGDRLVAADAAMALFSALRAPSPAPLQSSAGDDDASIRVQFDVDTARRSLAPLVGADASVPLANLAEDGPLPRHLHAIGRALLELPESVQSVSLRLTSTPHDPSRSHPGQGALLLAPVDARQISADALRRLTELVEFATGGI